MNVLRRLLCAIFVLALALPAHAQEVWSNHVQTVRLDLNGTYGCTFYNAPNGTGARWRVDGKLNQRYENKPFLSKPVAHVPVGLRPASLECDDNKWARCLVLVYSQPSFKGESQMFHGARGMINLPSVGWPIGKMKSFEIRCQPTPVSGSGKIEVDRLDPDVKVEVAGTKHGCKLYLDPNGSGRNWYAFVTIPRATVTKQNHSKVYNASSAWDRQLSSLQCDADARVDCSVVVYSELNRRGQDGIFYGRMGLINLAQYGWNDRIRSLEVMCTRR